MNWSSMVPISTTGHSARPATSSSSPSSGIISRPMHESRLLDAFEDDRLALLGIQHDMAVVQLLLRNRRSAATSILPSDRKRWPRGVAAVDAGETRTAPLRHRRCRGWNAAAAPSAPRRPAPAHGFRPGQLRHRLGQISASTSAVSRPCAFDHRDIDIALGRLLDLELVLRQAGLSQKPFDAPPAGASTLAGLSVPRAHPAAWRASRAIASVSRRGPAKRLEPSNSKPRSDSAPTTSRSRSAPRPPACARGFLRESSSRRSGISADTSACIRPSALSSQPRSRPWPARAPGRYRRRARSR